MRGISRDAGFPGSSPIAFIAAKSGGRSGRLLPAPSPLRSPRESYRSARPRCRRGGKALTLVFGEPFAQLRHLPVKPSLAVLGGGDGRIATGYSVRDACFGY